MMFAVTMLMIAAGMNINVTIYSSGLFSAP